MMAQANTPIDITPDAVLDGVHHHMNRTRTHISRKQGSLQADKRGRLVQGACMHCLWGAYPGLSLCEGVELALEDPGGSLK